MNSGPELTPALGRRPLGLIGLVGFFLFGTLMSLIAAIALIAGSRLDAIWKLNPEAHASLQPLGWWAAVLMLGVSSACGAVSVGLWRRRLWGYRLALAVLTINLLGDGANAILRRDWRTLIGVPVGGALIAYLLRLRSRGHFA